MYICWLFITTCFIQQEDNQDFKICKQIDAWKTIKQILMQIFHFNINITMENTS